MTEILILLSSFITYTVLKDIIGMYNSRRIYEEMKQKNKEIELDNQRWKQEVRDLLTK